MKLKNLRFQLGALGVALVLSALTPSAFGQVVYQKVGNNPTTINASAQMEVESTTKGFLPPRMTNAQMIAIVPSATNNGLVVYSTTANATTGSPIGLYTVNNSNGTYAWEYIGSKQSVFTALTAAATTLATNSAGTSYTLDATANNMINTLPIITINNKGQSIELTRIDNSAVYSVQIAANGTNNIAGSTSLYLYSQNESVTLRNDGVSTWRIVASNRQGVANATKSFLMAELSASQTTNITSGVDHIKFNVLASSYGSDITLDAASTYQGGTVAGASIGRFLLQAGKTYRLTGNIGKIGSNAGYVALGWWVPAATPTRIGTDGYLYADNGGNQAGGSGNAEAVYTPATDTYVELKISLMSGLSSIGTANAYIEVLSDIPSGVPTDAAKSQVYGTVDYASSITPSASVTSANDVTWGSVSGNITNTGVLFTLKAGKTYDIQAVLGGNFATGNNASINYYILTEGGTPISSLGLLFNQVNQATGGTETPGVSVVYTPTVDTKVKVRVTFVSGTQAGANVGSGFLKITQIGTSAYTDSGWLPYTASITSSTGTNPTFGVTPVALYKVVGKSLHINFYLSQVAAGANGGTAAAVYKISMPVGYTINTGIVSPTTGTACAQGNGHGYNGTVLGTGTASNIGTRTIRANIVSFGDNKLGVFFDGGVSVGAFDCGNTLWGNQYFQAAANPLVLRFTAEIPIE